MLFPGSGQEAHGLLGENMLGGGHIPVGPQTGYLPEAFRQGTEPLLGLPGSHIPAQVRAVGFIELSNGIHAPPGEALNTILVSLNKHRIGGEIPPEQNILRVFEKMGHKIVPDQSAGFGIANHGSLLRHGGNQADGIGLGPQVQIQLFRPLVDLRNGQKAVDHLLKETAAGIVFVILRLQVKLGNVVLLGPLSFDFLAHLVQHGNQTAFGNGLQQIPLHTNGNGLLGVFKIIVAGENDDFHLRKLLQNQTAQGQAVHKGHPDVGNQHIRLGLPDHRQGHFPVCRFSHKLITASGPGDRCMERLPNDALVLHQKNTKHNFPPIFLFLALLYQIPQWQCAQA